MTLGEKIKMLRSENNMMQKELAKILNIAPPTLTNYEKDHREPNFETLKKLSEIFDVSIDWLLGVVENRTETKTKLAKPPEKYKKILDTLGIEDIAIFEDAEMEESDWVEVIEFLKKIKNKAKE